jgi:hypothetical protein
LKPNVIFQDLNKRTSTALATEQLVPYRCNLPVKAFKITKPANLPNYKQNPKAPKFFKGISVMYRFATISG